MIARILKISHETKSPVVTMLGIYGAENWSFVAKVRIELPSAGWQI